MDRLYRLTAAIWLGSAVFLMLVAAAVFRVADSPGVAGDVVGAMLTRWHYIAIAAPLILFVIALRSGRNLLTVVLFIALVLAALQALADLRARSLRMRSSLPMSSRLESDPIRRQFGMLHGVSSLLLVLQTIAAVVAVANPERSEGSMEPQPRRDFEEPPSEEPPRSALHDDSYTEPDPR